MGNCCYNDADGEQNNETNMAKNHLKTKQRNKKMGNNQYQVYTIIKAQALIRGFLTRRMVKKIYGFESTPGLLQRGTVHIEMDPDKLEEQRARVLQIREGLPEFQYGRDDDEDYEPGV